MEVVRVFGDEAFEERADNGEGAHAVDEVRIKVLHFRPVPFVQDLKAVALINVRFGLVTRACREKAGPGPGSNQGTFDGNALGARTGELSSADGGKRNIVVDARSAKGILPPMQNLIEKSLLAFIPLFVAIDPIGLIAVFMGLAPNASREVRKRQGMLGIVTGFAVSIGFIFLGKFIFRALGISVSDFQVAGGLILLGLAARELIGGDDRTRTGSEEFGIVPLGMPLIAGPALLTALLILVDTVGVVFTIGSLIVNLRSGAGRFPICPASRSADGKAGPKRSIQTDRALAGRDRGQLDPARLARRLADRPPEARKTGFQHVCGRRGHLACCYRGARAVEARRPGQANDACLPPRPRS